MHSVSDKLLATLKSKWVDDSENKIPIRNVDKSRLSTEFSRVNTSVTLVFVGDIAPDGVIFYQDKHAYCSYNQTFELVAPHLQQSDLTIGNLEAPFVTEDMEKYESKEYYPRLRSKPESAYSLKYAGFNILGLNNNHLTDFKEKPIKFTVNLLNKIGIKTFGYTSGTIKENRPQSILISLSKN
ncbi:Capsule biosynthesis protein CapA [Exaiptasia diaphana]|nr:Capsule biosynthesis protein CapA [Exaiptasia diaphana]